MLEAESQETVVRQLQLFQERALPDLENNIKCGNSLIASDFYDNVQLSLLDEEERYRVNVFDWEEGFPEIMKAGGFDAVIGNPPYVRQESLSRFKDYLKQHYQSYNSVADLYVYFIEQGLNLLRSGGFFSVIVSSSFLRTTYAVPLRQYLRENYALLQFVDFGGLAVFAKAKDTYVCIPILSKQSQPDQIQVSKIESLKNLDLITYVPSYHYSVPNSRFISESWLLINNSEFAVFEKIKTFGVELSQYINHRIFSGIKTGINKAFEISEDIRNDIIQDYPHCAELIKPFVGGQDIRRYYIDNSSRYLIVMPSGWTLKQIINVNKNTVVISEEDAWNWLNEMYSPIAKHLESFIDAAKNRQDQGQFWWELRPCDYYDVLENHKIIYPDIAKYPRFYLDITGAYIANTAYCLGTDDLYLLGILNSQLFWFAISCISIPFGTRAGKFRYRLIYQYMEKVPIRTINFSDLTDKARHNQMVQLVQQMLSLQTQLATAKIASDKNILQRQINATDRQINQLVYELYELSDEEIKIIEEATR